MAKPDKPPGKPDQPPDTTQPPQPVGVTITGTMTMTDASGETYTGEFRLEPTPVRRKGDT